LGHQCWDYNGIPHIAQLEVSAFLVHSIRFCTMQSEVADVLRKVGSKIESYGLTWQLRTLYAIKVPNSGVGWSYWCVMTVETLPLQLLPQQALSQVSNKREDWIQARETELCQCHTSTWFYPSISIH
jgi:hypothetical protein